MSREEFYALSDGMDEHQKAMAFHYLMGALQVYSTLPAITPEQITETFRQACVPSPTFKPSIL